MNEPEAKESIAKRLRNFSRRFAKTIAVLAGTVASMLFIVPEFFSTELRAIAWVAVLTLILLVGPGYFFLAVIGVAWKGFWIPLRLTFIWIADNWEAVIILLVQVLVWAARQKWTIFLVVLGMMLGQLSVQYEEPLVAYLALAASLALVIYRLIEQFVAHLSWNSILSEIAESIEEHAVKPKEKPKLRRTVILANELEDPQFGKVASAFVSYMVLENIISKIRSQYLKLIMHACSILSLVYSVAIMLAAACIAQISFFVLHQPPLDSPNWASIAFSMLRDIFSFGETQGHNSHVITGGFKIVLALQVFLFLRTIFETTKSAVDQFIRRLEGSLEKIRMRKFAEINFVFGHTPDELGAIVKKRGKQFESVIDAIRRGRTSEALRLLKDSKLPKKDLKLLTKIEENQDAKPISKD